MKSQKEEKGESSSEDETFEGAMERQKKRKEIVEEAAKPLPPNRGKISYRPEVNKMDFFE